MTTAIATDNPELDAYKERVATVARLYAEQHGWCTVVNEALAEIEAEVPAAIEDMIQDALEGAFDRGRDEGDEHGRQDEHDYAVQQAEEKYDPVLTLITDVLRWHNDEHTQPAMWCDTLICRSAYEAERALD